jgi:hypothetical protein
MASESPRAPEKRARMPRGGARAQAQTVERRAARGSTGRVCRQQWP